MTSALKTPMLSRRGLIGGTALTLGAAAILRGALTPQRAFAQAGDMPAGDLHSFTRGGVTFHTYMSPAQAVHVTSHIVEFEDQLLLVDATMLPPTATEVASIAASTGKSIGMAIISHEHPDHWGGAAAMSDVQFSTLPQIRETLRPEATGGNWPEPTNVLNGGDVTLGMTEMSGVPIEFRHYEGNEAEHMLVAVLPEQKTAIVQDLVYNGVYFAPGVNRQNWITTLEALRDDTSFDTLLVGHGLPTLRGEIDTAIAYITALDEVMNTAENPEEAMAILKERYPTYAGEFLLTLIEPYWTR